MPFGAAVPIFTPKSLAGNTLWTRGDLGVTGTTTASTWADQSGNGNNFVQGTGANQPAITAAGIGTRQTLGFNGSTSFMTCATPLSSLITASAFTVFAVWNYTGAVATQAGSVSNPLIVEDTSEYFGMYASNANLVSYVFAGADVNRRPAAAGGAAHYGYSQLGGGNLSSAVDGGAAISVACGNVGSLAGTMSIGNGFTFFFTGQIGELIFYNRALSAGEIAQVQAYLHTTWGI